MSAPIITLTTDFGSRSPFVAAMKGVLLCINPDARVVDLSHDIPPFDIRHAAFFLADALPYFPPGVRFDIPYDSSRFVKISISQVAETLLEAVASSLTEANRPPSGLTPCR